MMILTELMVYRKFDKIVFKICTKELKTSLKMKNSNKIKLVDEDRVFNEKWLKSCLLSCLQGNS